MTASMRGLASKSQEELDDLFRSSPAGAIPDGDSSGTAIFAAGTGFTAIGARLARWLAWRGKVVDARKATLRNKITPFSVRAIKAAVYKSASWFDGQEAIILDYSRTSLVAQKIRDEIREVAPGLYLGQVYWGEQRIANFALQFGDAGRAEST